MHPVMFIFTIRTLTCLKIDVFTMRLLKFDNRGELSLTKDLIESIPSYAILSHTWGDDEEGVKFNE
jgi:hypothetical protein